MRVDEQTYKLLNLLINSTEPLSGTSLAKELGISLRSIQNYTKIIKILLESRGYSLQSKPGVGYFFNVSEVAKSNLIRDLDLEIDYSFSSKFRRNFIFNKLFSYKTGFTISSLSHDLYVSKSVILKDLDELDDWLKHFNVKIERRQNCGVFLTGDELAIRRAYIAIKDKILTSVLPIDAEVNHLIASLDKRILLEDYQTFLRAYQFEFIKEIQQVIIETEKELETNFTANAIMNLMKFITLITIRQRAIPKIPDNSRKSEILRTKEYRSALKLLESLSKKIGINIPVEEAYYLAVVIIISDRQYSSTDIMVKFAHLDPSIPTSTKNLLNHLGEMLNISLVDNKELVMSVSLFIGRMRFQARFFEDFFSDQHKSTAYKVDDYVSSACISSHGIFSRFLGFDLNNESLLYIALLVSNAIAGNRGYIEGIYISPLDYYTAQNKAQLLEANIPELRIVDIIPYYKAVGLDWVDLSKEKIIISALPLEKSSYLKNVINVADLSDVEELRNARREILRYHTGKSKKDKKKREWLFPQLISLDVSAPTKFDAISYGCQLLRKGDFIDDAFESDAIQREILSSTSLGQGIALPHGSLDHVKRSAVCIIKLNKPIHWSDKEEVDLVFVMAFNFRNKEILRRESLELYRLLTNQIALNQIRKAKTKEKLVEIIGAINNHG